MAARRRSLISLIDVAFPSTDVVRRTGTPEKPRSDLAPNIDSRQASSSCRCVVVPS
jgi:hypothetical protein